jgi:hypothetical protein
VRFVSCVATGNGDAFTTGRGFSVRDSRVFELLAGLLAVVTLMESLNDRSESTADKTKDDAIKTTTIRTATLQIAVGIVHDRREINPAILSGLRIE